jgi:hypothetical protein
LERDLAGSSNKWVWKARIPLKIKTFMWLLFQDAILARDNLIKQQCKGFEFPFATVMKQLNTCPTSLVRMLE